MKIRSLKCKCDRCDKEISETQHDGNRIVLYPSKSMYGTVRYKEVHLCNECLEKVFKFTKTFLKMEDEDNEDY